MLITFLALATIVFWGSIVVMYFRPELYRWFDNRFGPKHRPEKPLAPPKRRMYD